MQFSFIASNCKTFLLTSWIFQSSLHLDLAVAASAGGAVLARAGSARVPFRIPLLENLSHSLELFDRCGRCRRYRRRFQSMGWRFLA